MDRIHLKALQDMSYQKMEKNTLRDVSKITLDKATSILERVEAFINEVQNPYIMKCGNTIVEVEFLNNKKTIDSQIKSYLKALKQGDFTCRIW